MKGPLLTACVEGADAHARFSRAVYERQLDLLTGRYAQPWTGSACLTCSSINLFLHRWKRLNIHLNQRSKNMVATTETIAAVEDFGTYKYGFVTDIETEKAPKG